MVFQSMSLWWRSNGQYETTASDMGCIIARIACKEIWITRRIEIRTGIQFVWFNSDIYIYIYIYVCVCIYNILPIV